MKNLPDMLLSHAIDRKQLDPILNAVLGAHPCRSTETVLSEGPSRDEACIWYDLVPRSTSGWPLLVSFMAVPEAEHREPEPYVLLAEALHATLHIDSVCFAQDYVGGLDPHDPYWSLAYWKGLWYLADDSVLDADDPGGETLDPHVILYGPMERERFLGRGYTQPQLSFALRLPPR
jgi:hypothetical protein